MASSASANTSNSAAGSSSSLSADFPGLSALLQSLPPLPELPKTLAATPAAPAKGKGISLNPNSTAVVVPGPDPTRNPLDAFRLAIASELHAVLGPHGVSLKDAYDAPAYSEKAPDLLSVALPRFRIKSPKPDELAAQVVAAFKPNAYISHVEAKGAFLHFTIDYNTLARITLGAISELTYSPSLPKDPQTGKPKHSYGTNEAGKGHKILVEFSSPNIAKPFHAGHLRSTIIGAFLGNLYEANGWSVERWNYLGDWGKQFGLLAVGWSHFGSEEELKADAVAHLYSVYVQINKLASEQGEEGEVNTQARAFFKRMEDGDEEAIALWKKFRDLSIVKYAETYDRLNIRFDHYSGESQVKKENISDILGQLRTAPFVAQDKGAYLADLSAYKLEKAIIERKDGTPLYITRDLAEACQRWNKDTDSKCGKGFDKMIYVVASQQDLHLAQFFKVLELMGYDFAQPAEQRLVHINFGMVLGMSTRKGTAVFLDQILQEAKENMHAVMKENDDKYNQVEDPERTADVVGMTAVKIQDMQAKRINNYEFKWERMLSFKGDTGPYLQYNHVRLCSVERKLAAEGVALPDPYTEPIPKGLDAASLLADPKAKELIMHLASYPDVVRNTYRDHQPSTVVSYCFRLCHAVASAWEVLLVKGQEREVALVRLWLYRCAKDVLGSALRLLTVTPLERM
ncbi:arginyl-tRNA synthetase [Tilletia horrida]|nr:arginyl-tRNA synthetase [Tilletia horrida]KAK0566943.1 arginyl-tRNA synthetase [Tilletia horrida]